VGNKRTPDKHVRFHDLVSKIEKHEIDLHDMEQRKQFAHSIVTVLPQFPNAWARKSKNDRSPYSRVMHTLNAVVNGRQHTFNSATEAAIRAGLAYHMASDEIQTEAVLSRPRNNLKTTRPPFMPKLEPITEEEIRQAVIEGLIDEQTVNEIQTAEDKLSNDFTTRERLLLAWMTKDEAAFLDAVKEVR
jgi:microcompartment protein CcmL/EutN